MVSIIFCTVLWFLTYSNAPSLRHVFWFWPHQLLRHTTLSQALSILCSFILLSSLFLVSRELRFLSNISCSFASLALALSVLCSFTLMPSFFLVLTQFSFQSRVSCSFSWQALPTLLFWVVFLFSLLVFF